MPVMNFDLDDGLPSVSFTLKYEDADRFIAFMQHCYDLEQTVDNLKRHSSEVEDQRDALVAHVELLTRVAEKLSTVAPEYLDHLAADAHLVLRDAPTTSLARLKAELWQREGCICQGCGERYRDDLIVDDALWECIKPEGKAEGAGLLCSKCIFARALPALKAEWQEDELSAMIAAIPFSESLARDMLKHRRDELRRLAEEPSA